MYTIQEIAVNITGDLNLNTENTAINHYSIDSRSIKNGEQTLFYALEGKSRDGHTYIDELIDKGVRNFIVSKPLNREGINFILVSNVLVALQELAKNHREKFNIPVIGITGSHGKTIVKEWLSQLLSPDYTICKTPKSYNSQIGVPLSVLNLNNKHTLALFEAGISQTNEMQALKDIIQPTLGVFTGLSDAHNAGFSSLEQKKEEKFKLFNELSNVFTPNINSDSYTLPFNDQASIENVRTCIAVMQGMAYSQNIIQERINDLSPLALRLEMVNGKDNNIIINDSYSITIDSLAIAIDYLQTQSGNNPKVLILSDVPDYNYNSNELASLINKGAFEQVISVGEHKIEGLSAIYTHFPSVKEFFIAQNQLSIKNSHILIKGARAFLFERIVKKLEEKKHQTQLVVNLSQIERNLKAYRDKLNPLTKLMVMVKAFSYGSGQSEIPKLLQFNGVDYLGVAYTDEGVQLREKGITTPIMVMNPEPDNFDLIISHQLEPEIYSLNILDEFIRALILNQKKDYPIHLKIDTGMNRLGFKTSDEKQLLDQLKAQPEVYVKSMFSHLSSADSSSEKEFTKNQLKTFKERSEQLINELGYPVDRHVLNTSGIEAYNDFQFDMVRLGIGLYGINAAVNNDDVQSASSLESVIIQKKKVLKGESVGYGRAFIATKDMMVGIVPIGYADGIKRSLGNGKFSFYVNNTEAPILGNVCMDLTIIDLTHVNCKEGDKVEVFGEHQTIEDLAVKMETIPYEVLTSISQRVKRVFIRD